MTRTGLNIWYTTCWYSHNPHRPPSLLHSLLVPWRPLQASISYAQLVDVFTICTGLHLFCTTGTVTTRIGLNLLCITWRYFHDPHKPPSLIHNLLVPLWPPQASISYAQLAGPFMTHTGLHLLCTTVRNLHEPHSPPYLHYFPLLSQSAQTILHLLLHLTSIQPPIAQKSSLYPYLFKI